MIKKFTIAIFLITLFLSMVCFAQGQHPIDKFEEDEIAKDSTTVGMNNATLKALEKWDAELNKYYKSLMDSLDESSKTILKSSQIEWIRFRDLEIKNIDNIFGQMQGAMYTTMAIASKKEIVKRRALDLKEYYELLEER